MFETILRAIQDHPVIILHRHQSPDGDALGSQIGLKHLILDNLPGKTVYMVGDPAGRYDFMADCRMDEIPDAAFQNALSIILDTSGKSLISDGRFALAHETARIDHHLFVEQIARLEVTDSSYESCCGLVTEMALECGWKLSLLSAQSLYTGMVTDSGRFRYDSTSGRTFRLAAFLLSQPIDLNILYRNLYETDLDQVRLRGLYMQKIRRTAAGVAYIRTEKEELAALNADAFTISRGMVGLMNDIRGVDVWVNFTETASGILCELRSTSHNINAVAVKYGGGGHIKASGATLKTWAEAQAMLSDLDQLLTQEANP